MNSYDDIMNIKHFDPKNHPRMPITSRAAQFAPFAALTGYDDAIKETGRITEGRIEIDDGLKEYLNSKIQILKENIKKEIKATFTYFIYDKTKDGGEYQTKEGIIKKIDNSNITLIDNTQIPILEIIDITSSIFKE